MLFIMIRCLAFSLWLLFDLSLGAAATFVLCIGLVWLWVVLSFVDCGVS